MTVPNDSVIFFVRYNAGPGHPPWRAIATLTFSGLSRETTSPRLGTRGINANLDSYCNTHAKFPSRRTKIASRWTTNLTGVFLQQMFATVFLDNDFSPLFPTTIHSAGSASGGATSPGERLPHPDPNHGIPVYDPTGTDLVPKGRPIADWVSPTGWSSLLPPRRQTKSGACEPASAAQSALSRPLWSRCSSCGGIGSCFAP